MTRALALALVAVPVLASAQSSLDEYLKVRKQYGITQAASSIALDTFVGDRVVEVQGVISGSISVGDATTIILVNPEGGDIYVSSKKVPDWMTFSNVAARLIVRASRSGESSKADAQIIAAWPEGDVAQYEAKLRAAEEARKAAEARKRAAKPPASRGGKGRPAPLPGNIPPALGVSPLGDNPPFSAETEAMVPRYAAYIKSVNRKLPNEDAEQIARAIVGYGVRYGVDPRLVMALVQAESDFRPATTSHKGAMGLGQIMPDEKARFGLSDAYATDQNLYATVRLLREDIEKYSKTHGETWNALILSLAAYNAGHGAVKKYGYQVPPYKETQNYVRKVIANYKAFCGIKD
ncbi:MAG: lytic transglycosylase domain-containing protein [Fimbriimonadaceae bacterium]|nr:lytic transglycosylase domain-containing protein [Fimbriimonadaceae bacterium]